MDNVIDFTTAKSSRQAGEAVEIDTKKRGPELNRLLDELWMELHTGKELVEIRADEQGRIFYKTALPKETIFSHENVMKHLRFLIEYYNRNYLFVLGSFHEDYQEFLRIEEVTPLLQTKEKHS